MEANVFTKRDLIPKDNKMWSLQVKHIEMEIILHKVEGTSPWSSSDGQQALPTWISAAACSWSMSVHYTTRSSTLECVYIYIYIYIFFFPVGTVSVGGGNLQVAPPTNTWWELVEKWLQLSIASDGIMLRSAEHCQLRSLTSWSLRCLIRNMVFNEPVNQNLRNGNVTEVKRFYWGFVRTSGHETQI